MVDVEEVLLLLSKRLGISKEGARRLLHRYICKGKCNWYKKEAKSTGFADVIITDEQVRVIEEILDRTMGSLSHEDRFKRIHKYICPGEPCSM